MRLHLAFGHYNSVWSLKTPIFRVMSRIQQRQPQTSLSLARHNSGSRLSFLLTFNTVAFLRFRPIACTSVRSLFRLMLLGLFDNPQYLADGETAS